MNEPSEEQQIIINHIKNGDNAIVDACAGSGKSTTILSCALALPHKKIIQMTYNSALREDIVTKTGELHIRNIEVHTYHSLAVKYFLRSAHTDTGIRNILENQLPNLVPVPSFDIVVLDEAQDMTLLYFRFIQYFTKKIANSFQILVLGDWMQGLYEFKGADTRFLTLAKEIWEGYPQLLTNHFHQCTLHVSYRITRPMAKFVNQVMIGDERLISCKDGQKVMYIRNSRTNIEKVVVYNIRKLLDEGAEPSDIFVLGGSVSGPNSNIRKMENALVESGIPTHVPMMETAEKIDERVIRGKVVFSTFHTVKGRQRKYVFVVGFDNTYFTFCARTADPMICPNTLYVAATRATHGLYLMESDQYSTDRPLDFLLKSHHEMKNECSDYIDFKGMPRTIFYEQKSSFDICEIPTHHVTPTKLIKFLPESVLEELSPLLDKIFIREMVKDTIKETINETVEIPILDEDICSFLGKNLENNDMADDDIDDDMADDDMADDMADDDNDQNTPKLSQEIDIPSIIKTKNGNHEDVSDLNGIAIPNIYYDYIQEKWSGQDNLGQNTILYDIIHSKIKEMKNNEHSFLKRLFHEMPSVCTKPADYLYMANMYVSVQERLYYKLKQIGQDEYSWLTDDIINKCKDRLDKTIGQECTTCKPEFEETIIHYTMEKEHVLIDAVLAQIYGQDAKFRFSGRIDLITEKSVWELKCTSTLTIDNLLQVAIYAWIWRTINVNNPEMMEKEFKILNIKTGEILVLNATIDELNFIMSKLLLGKYGKVDRLSDEDFLQGTYGSLVRTLLLQGTYGGRVRSREP